MISFVKYVRDIAMTRLPLSREASLSVLGVFHALCMAAIALIPMFNGYNPQVHGSRLDCGMALIIANAIVAVGITAPTSGHKPSEGWKALWGAWLLLGFVSISLIVHGINIRTLEFGDTQWADALTIATGNAELLLGLALSGAIALLVGCKDNKQVFGWSMWAGIVLLTMASYRNEALMWIPSYLLIFIGGYVAYASLGSAWLVTSIRVVTCVVAIPAIMITKAFIDNIKGVALVRDLKLLYSAPTTPIRSKMHAFCACYMLAFPAVTFSLVAATRKFWGKMLLSLMFIIQMSGLIFTGRRAAFTGSLLMVVLTAAWMYRIKARRVILASLAVILLVTMLDVSGVMNVRNYFLISESTYEHMVNGRSGLAAFVAHPILGTGFGHHKENGKTWALANHIGCGHIYGHAHNDYIDLLESGGLVGFGLAILAGLQLILLGKRLLLSSGSHFCKYITIGIGIQIAACAVTAALMFGQFLHPHYLFPATIMVSGLLGALLTEGEQRRTSSGQNEEKPVAMSAAD